VSIYPPNVGYRCRFCDRTTYLEADVRERYCPCCGSADATLPRVCEHRPACLYPDCGGSATWPCLPTCRP
jgi:hypothetical protein